MENNYSDDQKKFIEMFKRGDNIFLTGKAGTGKSFITQVAMEIADKEQMTYIAVAPTGIAAFNIGGQTMHSMFNLSINGAIKFDDCNFMNAKKRKVLQKAKVIFIDEVSMLRPDHLDAINWTLIKNGIEELTKKQIVFIGDLKQLPPPIDDNMKSMLLKSYDGYCFKDSHIYKKLNVQEIDLGQVLRQSDPTFIDNLNIIRNGGKSEYFRQFVGDDPGDGIILAPHNSTVQEYNKKGLNKIDSEEFVFKAEIDGKAKAYDFNLEETIVLKDGCQIMYLVNSKGNPLYNGSIGTYRRIDDKDFIEIDGEKWLIEEVIFKRKEYVFDEKSGEMNLEEVGSIRQIPVKLAYALTIHKAQGLTFEKVTVDLTKNCFAKGQLYTALSRVTGPEGLTIKIEK